MKNRNMIIRMLALVLMVCTLLLATMTGCTTEPADPTTKPNGPGQGTTTTPTTTKPIEVKPEPPMDLVEPEPDTEEPMLHLYISPKGSDSNNGKSEKKALKSLGGASKMLMNNPFIGNITIHMAEGEYLVEENMTWQYASPGYRITIEGAGKDKTVFYGPVGPDITFLQVSTCNNTSFTFKDFTVRVFRNGIIMRCSNDGSIATQKGVSGWFENVRFQHLGGYYTRNESSAVGAIQFLGSSNNTIKNCEFDGLRDYTTGNNIHGVYISTFSSNNIIQNCEFKDIRPDPVRIRRGSNNNIIEYNSFRNTGVVAYVSDWCAGEAEPEPSVGNIVRYNQFYSGYNGIQIANVCVFKPGTNTPSPLDPDRMVDLGNTVHPSEYNPVVNVSVKNHMVSVDGEIFNQTLPVYSMDRYENYVDLDDLAVLLRGTDFAYSHYVNEDEDGNITPIIYVSLNDSFTGTTLSVQPDAKEGELKANIARGWSISNVGISRGALYEINGKYYVSLDTMRDMLALSDQSVFRYEYDGDMLRIETVFEHVDVPETTLVYMLKLPGTFTSVGTNNGKYSLADIKNFDVITMKTKDLSHLIRFEDLIRDDMDFVVIGIPIGEGTWGVREWKNSAMQDYYYYGTNKLTGLNRTWVTSSGGYANCFYKDQKNLIFYTIVPVGQPLEKDPQYRIAQNWTTGSIHNYSEIFFTECDKFKPISNPNKVTIGSAGVTIEGASKGTVSMLTSALAKDYLSLNDLALLMKGTDKAFDYTVKSGSNQITVTMGGAFSGAGFEKLSSGTVNIKDWLNVTLKVGKNSTTVSAFNYNGGLYVDAEAFVEALGAYLSVDGSKIKIMLDLTLPDKMDVLMLNFDGNLENADATEIEPHKLEMGKASFTKVSVSTKTLSQYIKLLDLKKDGFQYVIVGVELDAGTWGVREFKNNAASEYYTYADRKWGTGSGGFSDWFYEGEESTVYYMIVPVGESSNSDPQLRIKQNWVKGSPVGYTQLTFTKCAAYNP